MAASSLEGVKKKKPKKDNLETTFKAKSLKNACMSGKAFISNPKGHAFSF